MPQLPNVPGLTFRPIDTSTDLAGLVDVYNRSNRLDGNEAYLTEEKMAIRGEDGHLL